MVYVRSFLDHQLTAVRYICEFSYLISLEELAFDQLTISNKELIAPCTPKIKVLFIFNIFF